MCRRSSWRQQSSQTPSLLRVSSEFNIIELLTSFKIQKPLKPKGHQKKKKKKKKSFYHTLRAAHRSVIAHSVLKAVQASYATSDTLFVCNGGPAQRDETADELWFRRRSCDENKGSSSSPRASVCIRGRPGESLGARVAEETAAGVHLLYSAIYFRGECGRVFGSRQKAIRA